MNKSILAMAIAALAGSGAVNAASWDDLSISGFGSVGVGKADNAIAYAGYTDDKVEWEQETLGGIQFDFQINERAKFVTQIVANSRYDYDPKIEMAYASYEFDNVTARAGKLRLPLFFYSDFQDVGYAYPMIRPSQETYENLLLKGHTGVDLLIPIEFENSSLMLQPVVGIATLDEDDSAAGEVKLDNMYGLAASWNYEDLTLRASYFVAEANPECGTVDFTNNAEVVTASEQCIMATALDLYGQDGTFVSAGMNYDNGSALVNIEATDVQLEGKYYDYRTVSGLVGYRVAEFTPYASVSWMETTDDDERPLMADEISYGLNQGLNFERIAYSVGSRWDFEKNMSLKLDVTYVDYQDTSGGSTENVVSPLLGGGFVEEDTLVYSARLDFVF
ncbi:hypothetical protein [Vibrio maerlii]|uniref:hypothetical protein n=1 Tax=Vibrio maerlii TaxID=2231648 RepID=UPI000E3BB4BC|nr:hypothetical protein [Vibrio maerlii]